MSVIDLDEIKKRSVVGVLALTSRTAILQIISFTATFLLTIFLAPEVFGVFFLVTAMIAFLNYFSDIGLAAALIQKKEAVSDADLKTTFTVQQVLVGIIVILAFLFSRRIALFYNLDAAGLWLFRALVLSFFLSSLKTIPSVIIERKLDFNKLIIPQIVEVLFFYLVAVFLAYRGFGVESFTYAVLFRGISGLLVIYWLEPWLPGLALNRESIRKLLAFGIPFQLNSFLALLKDDLFTLFLGKALPLSEVGYIGWAKKWSEVPLRLVMDSVIRVTFPAFSRLQAYRDKLGRGIDKSFFFLSIFILPMAVGLIFAVQPLVNLIPKYGKWQPAIFAFNFFVIASVFASLSTPLTNALNAIGRIKTTLKFMLLWLGLTWGLTPLLMRFFGFNGVAIAFAVIGGTFFLVVYVARKNLDFKILENILPALVGAVLMGGYLFFSRRFFELALPGLILYLFSGAIVYFLTLGFFFRRKIKNEFKSVYLILRGV